MNRKSVILDAALLAGSGLIVAGAWLIYPPVSMILAGAGLVYAVHRAVGPRRRNNARRTPVR